MSKYLRHKEYVSIGLDLKINEETHINHADCEAGIDTKRRLYIKRIDNGVLAYCHHCGKRGSYWEAFARVMANKKASSYASKKFLGTVPKDTCYRIEEWPSPARVWLRRYGITDKEVVEKGIGYSERYRRVVLPCEYGGKLRGYQLRKVWDNDDNPNKYLTFGEKPLFWYGKPSGKFSTLIVVEDIISGIKCSRFFPTLALLGSSLQDDLLSSIIHWQYDHYIIFLDDDNTQVRKSQVVIKNKLSLLGKTKLIKDIGKDPKELSHDELKILLDKYNRVW